MADQIANPADVQAALTNPDATALATPTPGIPASTAGFTPPAPSNPIPAGNAGSQTALDVGSTMPPAGPDAAAGIVGSSDTTSKTLQDYITANTAPETDAEKQQQSILDSISQLTNTEGQKGVDQAAAETNAGIPDMKTTLQNLNNELLTKTADYNTKYANAEIGIGQTSSDVLGQQGAIRKAQAADIGVVQAKISAAQGNLSLAQDQVNRAIDLKYSTVEAQLATKKAQLDALIPTLNREQQTTATALQQKYTDDQQKIADEKQKVKDNLNVVMQGGIQTPFVNNNGSFFDARTGQTFASPADFFKAAGVSSFAEAYQKGLISDVNPATLADKNLIAQAMAKYPDAGIKLTDTPEQMQAKLQNSRLYQKDTYIAGAGTGGAGAGGGQAIDLSKYSDQNAPQTDLGGLSANGLMQDAKLFLANSGKMPSLGLGSSAATQAKRNAIMNYAGQLADSMGLDINQISALYKANSKAAGQIIDRVAKIDTTAGTLTSQFPRLAELASKVGNLGITEQDITAGKAAAMRKFGSVDAANYIELLQTVRGDYSALQASLSGGRGGQYFAENAKDAIPLGLTPEQYQGIADTISQSAINAQKATSDEANNIINNYSSTGGSSSSTSIQLKNPLTGEIKTFDNMSDQDIQDALKSGFVRP